MLMYCISIFASMYTNLHLGVALLPLILVFAGLEIVLGFYFLYFI